MSSVNNLGDFQHPASVGLFGLDSKATLCAKSTPMSSAKTPQKTPNLPKASQTNSTVSKASNHSDEDGMLSLIGQMRELLAPTLAFHADSKDANRSDVRFVWDVKAIRGENEFFAHIKGSSSMPGLLEESQLHRVVERVGAEMLSKIDEPVISKFQELVNRHALVLLEEDENRHTTSAPQEKRPSITTQASEAELINEVNLYASEGVE